MHYFILTASKNRSQLFKVTGSTIAPFSLEGMPTSLADAWVGMEREDHMMNGQGAANDVMEQEEDKYMHDLARSLHTFLHNQHAPLVFFGVQEEYGMFKKYDQSGKLLDAYVHGSPDHLTLEQLKEKADPIVREYVHHKSIPFIEEYGNLLGTGRTTHDLPVILDAAAGGKVDVLLVTDGVEMQDTIIQDAMAHVAAHRGRIVFVASGALPEGAIVAAILRL